MENRTVDLVVDANIDFAYALAFENVSNSGFGEQVSPMDISDLSLRGSISADIEGTEHLADFSFRTVKPEAGITSIELDKATVKSLVEVADPERDKFNPRLRFVGYYDVISSNKGMSDVRILEGKVYISDGVTK